MQLISGLISIVSSLSSQVSGFIAITAVRTPKTHKQQDKRLPSARQMHRNPSKAARHIPESQGDNKEDDGDIGHEYHNSSDPGDNAFTIARISAWRQQRTYPRAERTFRPRSLCEKPPTSKVLNVSHQRQNRNPSQRCSNTPSIRSEASIQSLGCSGLPHAAARR